MTGWYSSRWPTRRDRPPLRQIGQPLRVLDRQGKGFLDQGGNACLDGPQAHLGVSPGRSCDNDSVDSAQHLIYRISYKYCRVLLAQLFPVAALMSPDGRQLHLRHAGDGPDMVLPPCSRPDHSWYCKRLTRRNPGPH